MEAQLGFLREWLSFCCWIGLWRLGLHSFEYVITTPPCSNVWDLSLCSTVIINTLCFQAAVGFFILEHRLSLSQLFCLCVCPFFAPLLSLLRIMRPKSCKDLVPTNQHWRETQVPWVFSEQLMQCQRLCSTNNLRFLHSQGFFMKQLWYQD